jgi:serine/threonine protein kinase
MNACPKCSRKCAADALACPSCGASLAATSATAIVLGTSHTALKGGATAQYGAKPGVAAQPAQHQIIGADSSPSGDARVGQVIGSYRIISLLGEGGMGFVYLAEHQKLGRKVALKMLRSEYANSPQVVRRFFAEAKAVNKISHEHIVEITDFIENDHGDNYFIMEYLKGTSLADALEHEQLPLERSLGIAAQTCSALAAVHEADIVHRDLKPDNIFLTERGGRRDFVKLLDFGIAKLLESDVSVPLQQTAAGVIMGTPEYMSPEQACGHPVDYRTDIYSLGVILYELTTGRKPFAASTFGEMIVSHTTEIPTAPAELEGLPHPVPTELNDLILECLAKAPEDRPQSTREIEERLRRIATDYSVRLERYESELTPNGLRRLAMLGGGAAVAVAAVAALFMSFGGTGKAAEPAAAPPPLAAAEPPTPETAPDPDPVPETIEISFSSTPSATVYRVGSAEPMGETPFSSYLPRSSEPVSFEFRRDGYETLVEEVWLETDAKLTVALTAETKARRRDSRRDRPHRSTDNDDSVQKKRKKQLRAGDVLDPFAGD